MLDRVLAQIFAVRFVRVFRVAVASWAPLSDVARLGLEARLVLRNPLWRNSCATLASRATLSCAIGGWHDWERPLRAAREPAPLGHELEFTSGSVQRPLRDALHS